MGLGFGTFIVSLFALIPGPIIFGRIIDSTCLIWNYRCRQRGNCLQYDPIKFRYYLHSAAGICLSFTVLCNFFIWFYGRNIDLYGDPNEKKLNQGKDDKETSLLPEMPTLNM